VSYRAIVTAAGRAIDPRDSVQRHSYSLPPRARMRLGGAMLLDLLDRPGRYSGRWPHDSMVRSPAASSPIPFS
jgi:hypothetical protein